MDEFSAGLDAVVEEAPLTGHDPLTQGVVLGDGRGRRRLDCEARPAPFWSDKFLDAEGVLESLLEVPPGWVKLARVGVFFIRYAIDNDVVLGEEVRVIERLYEAQTAGI
jgi:hypothetical protein